MIITVLTAIAITVFTTAGWFQIMRMRKTGSACDVSFWYVTCLTIGVLASWGIVMLSEASIFIQVERSLNVISALIVETALIYYKRKDRQHYRKPFKEWNKSTCTNRFFTIN